MKTKVITETMKLVDKNLPKILTISSMIGTAVTGGLSYRAAKKLDKIKEKKPIDYIKNLAPPVISGVVTMSMTYGLNHVHMSRYAALAGMYALSQADIKQYEEKIKEKLGIEEGKKTKKEVQKSEARPMFIERNKEINIHDLVTGRYFASTIDQISKACQKVNREIQETGRSNLNSFYRALGIGTVEAGELIQWHRDDVFDMIEVEWDSELDVNMRPWVTIRYDCDLRNSW